MTIDSTVYVSQDRSQLSPHQALRESLRDGLGKESRLGSGVAVKIIPDADDDLTSLSEEIKFLQDLRSPFVVSFIESLLFDNELWLVSDLFLHLDHPVLRFLLCFVR